MDHGRIVQGSEDGLHAVFHRQNEAGRQLTEAPAGIHQGGGIGEKAEFGHEIVEGVFHLPGLFFSAEGQFCLGDVAGDPAKHLVRCFDDLAAGVLFQIAAVKNGFGVAAELGALFPEDAAVEFDRIGGIQTEFLQFVVDDFLDIRHGNRLILDFVDLFAQMTADAHGRIRRCCSGAGQQVRETVVIPSVGGQVQASVLGQYKAASFGHGNLRVNLVDPSKAADRGRIPCG